MILFLMTATFLAYFIKGITGFGNTLVMGTLFSFALPNKVITPIDLMISLPTNAIIVWRERKSLDWKMIIPLSLMLLAGIIPGTLMLKFGSDWLLKVFLGLLVMGLAIEMYLRKEIKNTNCKHGSKFMMTLFGVLSGILCGLYGIGALLVAYISRHTDNRNAFRGNVCCIFLVENSFRLILYIATGLFTLEVIKITAIIAPTVALGLFAGIKADKRMNDNSVTMITTLLLLVTGVILMLKSLSGVFF